ncbi:MAG: CRISPR-associated endonuclease Cas2 [Gemmatimonadota bacterium]
MSATSHHRPKRNPNPRARAYVVAYDIVDGSRRKRVHDLLLDFGVPIQYSVFECRLVATDRRRMLQAIRPLISLPGDALFVAVLCAACERRTLRVGGPVTETDTLVV